MKVLFCWWCISPKISSYLFGSLQPFCNRFPHVGQISIAITAGRNSSKARRSGGHKGLDRRSNTGHRGRSGATDEVFDVSWRDHSIHPTTRSYPRKIDSSLSSKLLGGRTGKRSVTRNGSPNWSSDDGWWGRDSHDWFLRVQGLRRGWDGSSEVFIDSLGSLNLSIIPRCVHFHLQTLLRSLNYD